MFEYERVVKPMFYCQMCGAENNRECFCDIADRTLPLLIGRSLSICVSDVLKSRVGIGRVEVINSCCKEPKNEAELHKLWEIYAETYWRERAEKAWEILLWLFRTKRITWGGVHDIVFGHWVDANSGEVFSNERIDELWAVLR